MCTCNQPYEESEEYHGYTIRIINDDAPLNPRTDYDNLGTMACVHSSYNLGDEGGMENLRDSVRQHPLWHDCWQDYTSDKFQAEDEDHDWWVQKAQQFGFVVLPLYLYDHSGITMRTSAFSCPWDSGMVGVIFASPATIRKEYGLGPKQRIPKKVKEHVSKVLQGEVETYDQYLRGDVWGYSIEDKDGEEEDSVWGFFGQDYCLEEAKSVVDTYLIPLAIEQQRMDLAKRQLDMFGPQDFLT